MLENLKIWLSKYLGIEDPRQTESFFRNENVTGFLVMWAIFERDVFSGFVKYRNLASFASQSHDIWNEALNSEFFYFHNRYQNEVLYKNLIHKDDFKEIREIKSKQSSAITDQEKLSIVLYVVYRYRNNIFHGSKGVESWLQFSPQIERCVKIMIEILNSKHNEQTLD